MTRELEGRLGFQFTHPQTLERIQRDERRRAVHVGTTAEYVNECVFGGKRGVQVIAPELEHLHIGLHASRAEQHVEVGDRTGGELGRRDFTAREATRFEASQVNALASIAVDEHETLAASDDEDAIETWKAGERSRFVDRGLRDAPVEIASRERSIARPERELRGDPATVLPRYPASVGGRQVDDLAHSLEERSARFNLRGV